MKQEMGFHFQDSKIAVTGSGKWGEHDLSNWSKDDHSQDDWIQDVMMIKVGTAFRMVDVMMIVDQSRSGLVTTEFWMVDVVMIVDDHSHDSQIQDVTMIVILQQSISKFEDMQACISKSLKFR